MEMKRRVKEREEVWEEGRIGNEWEERTKEKYSNKKKTHKWKNGEGRGKSRINRDPRQGRSAALQRIMICRCGLCCLWGIHIRPSTAPLGPYVCSAV